MGYTEIMVRALLVFVTMMTLSRLLGRQFIAQMTFFDLVAAISLGSMAGSIVTTKSLPVSVGLVGLGVFALFALASAWLEMKSLYGRKLVKGQSALVIKDGKVLGKELRKHMVTYDLLMTMLRKKDVFYLDEVELAYLETDGTLSVLKKPGNMPVTNKELNMPTTSRGLPLIVIMDGKLMLNNLYAAGKNEAWLREKLEESEVADVSQVSVAQVDGNGTVYIDKREDGVIVH